MSCGECRPLPGVRVDAEACYRLLRSDSSDVRGRARQVLARKLASQIGRADARGCVTLMMPCDRSFEIARITRAGRPVDYAEVTRGLAARAERIASYLARTGLPGFSARLAGSAPIPSDALNGQPRSVLYRAVVFTVMASLALVIGVPLSQPEPQIDGAREVLG